jgi:hypothetical protein
MVQYWEIIVLLQLTITVGWITVKIKYENWIDRWGSNQMAVQVKDYTLVERLGSGSYATVYKGFKKVRIQTTHF